MANVHGIFAIIATAFAAFSALFALDIVLIVPAGFALVVGILITTKHRDEKMVMVGGIVAAVLGAASIVILLAGVAEYSLVAALALAANIELAGTSLKATWSDLPQVAAIATATALLASVVLAFVFQTGIGDLLQWSTLAAGGLALAGLYPAITLVRS
jgi:hypothetical protein